MTQCKKWEAELTLYPEIESAVNEIGKAVLRDIKAATARAEPIFWEPSLTCANCGKCHDKNGKLDPPMAHVGKIMDEHSVSKQILEGVARWLQERV
jgi:hypothetical protein